MTLRCSIVAMLILSCGGFSEDPPLRAYNARDVSGNYQLTSQDNLRIKLDVAGALREVTHQGYSGIVDFGMHNGQPLTLNLQEFCAKPEISCPSELLWKSVSINQPDLKSNNFSLQNLQVIDNSNPNPDAGIRAANFGGLVNHDDADKFLLGLGGAGASSANCFLLGISLAGGQFDRVGESVESTMENLNSRGQRCGADAGSDAGILDSGVSDSGPSDAGLPVSDAGIVELCTLQEVRRRVVPANAKVAGIRQGKIFVGYTGGCAFGPLLAGATLTIETDFSGKRTGDYSPPAFNPAPVVLPDGGWDSGVRNDAGP